MVEKAQIRSSRTSSSVVMLRTTSTNSTRAIPQSCVRYKSASSTLREVRERCLEAVRGTRAILQSYERYRFESDSSKLQEDAEQEEEKYANRPAMVEANH